MVLLLQLLACVINAQLELSAGGLGPHNPMSTCRYLGRVRAWRAATVCGLRRQWRAGDLDPGLKSLGPGGTVFGGGAVVAVEMEEVGDRIVNGEKALNLLR